MRTNGRLSRRSLRRSRAQDDDQVRCEHVDALTDVIALDGELTQSRLDRLRSRLTDSLRTGAAFVVVDLATATPGVAGVDQVLADVAGPLARREGGLAIVGTCARVPRADVGVYSTRAEALAGVRGRLTPRRSIDTRPLRVRGQAR
jgi:hypothetical protein